MVEIGLLPEALLIVFVVIAESYWSEARDYYFKSMDETISRANSELFYSNSYIARNMFALCNLGMLLSLLAIIVRIYSSSLEFLNSLIIVFIVPSVILLVIFLIMMMSKKYALEYPDPRKGFAYYPQPSRESDYRPYTKRESTDESGGGIDDESNVQS